MARRKVQIPKYCHHKSDDSAVCYVDRRMIYLGPFESKESRVRYAELIASLQVSPETAPKSSPPPVKLVSELCVAFGLKKIPTYADAEQHCFKSVVGLLVELFSDTLVTNFGPNCLRTVRDAMIAKGWSSSR